MMEIGEFGEVKVEVLPDQRDCDLVGELFEVAGDAGEPVLPFALALLLPVFKRWTFLGGDGIIALLLLLRILRGPFPLLPDMGGLAAAALALLERCEESEVLLACDADRGTKGGLEARDDDAVLCIV